jgi:hypothetical protein
MTVDVDLRPAACDASMISTQRATGSLLGEIRSRTPSCSTSAAVPGVESRPASRSRWNTSTGGRPDTVHMWSTSIAEYACMWTSGAISFATRSQCS